MKLDNLAMVKSVAKTLVLGMAVLLATGAFASNNKGSLHVQEAVEINGQQIPAGYYEVRWQGTGSNVELSFMQGKKEIAKTSAKEIELNEVPDLRLHGRRSQQRQSDGIRSPLRRKENRIRFRLERPRVHGRQFR